MKTQIEEIEFEARPKSKRFIMNSKTKATYESVIPKNVDMPITVSDFVPDGEIICVKKDIDESPEIVYGNDITYLPYNVLPKCPIYREPEVKSKLRLKLARSNINDIINTDDGTVTFTLSFYKKKDCYKIYEFHDKKGFKHTITIHLTKPYKDGFNFTYYDLEVRHQADAGGPIETVGQISIPDSYKKWCDCVAYMHGIYREEKDSCYKVIAVFGHNKALFGEKIILK